MQLVNTITQFFTKLFVKTENERREKDESTLYKGALEVLASAPPDTSEEERVQAREAYLAMGVITFATAAAATVPASVKAAGRVLAHIVYPDDAAKLEGREGRPYSAEEIKQEAYKALELITETNQFFKPLITAAMESLDVAAVAEAVWDAGQGAEKAGEGVKAKPVAGDKKSPWTNRIKPSLN